MQPFSGHHGGVPAPPRLSLRAALGTRDHETTARGRVRAAPYRTAGCTSPDHHAAAAPQPHAAPPTAAPALPHNGGAEKAAAGLLGVILHDNSAFVQAHPPGYFQSFQDDQHPRATVVACTDSRFHLQLPGRRESGAPRRVMLQRVLEALAAKLADVSRAPDAAP